MKGEGQETETLQTRPDRRDRVLVLDCCKSSAEQICKIIEEQLQNSVIDTAASLEEYHKLISTYNYQIAVVEQTFRKDLKSDIVHELHLLDYEPSVLILFEEVDSKNAAVIYNSGADRCLMKKEGWLDELGPSVRHLIRFRKLEDENQNLLAKLTEANMLLGEKNKRLDEFTSTVAHDIRGPLAGISMKLEYLMDTYDREIDDRFQTLLSRALQTSQRLTDMVQSMYGFARLGKEAAKMIDVDLGVLVKQVIEDMHFDSELDIQFGIAELPCVWGSQELLRRVFSNLISNAVKYNDKETIIINIGLNDIREKSMARYAEVFVEDNGPGIGEDELEDIFSMFNRGVAIDPTIEGDGIGLAVVQRIVELHYGEVNVETKIAEGTKFLLALPMERIDFLK